MTTIRPADDWDAENIWQNAAEPLTAQEAQVLRAKSPALSPWTVVAYQGVVAVAVALAAWGLAGRSNALWSALYGGLVVVVPGALFARGLMSRFSSANVLTAALGFFVWDLVKILVSVAMLFLAPRWVADLDWLAMLIGLIVTLQVYWVALLMRPKQKRGFSGDQPVSGGVNADRNLKS